MSDPPFSLEPETPDDADAILRLNDRVFGPGRFALTAYRLMKRSLVAARAAGGRLAILVGDEPSYGKLGFVRTPPGRIVLPGPVDPERLLQCELQPRAFEGVAGKVRGAYR
jgi:predicted N-acetyltransferase YhbS